MKISDEEYFAIKRMSNSMLNEFAKSPGHYVHKQQHAFEQTDAFRIGSAFHCLVLEPNEFDLRYIVTPEEAPRKPSPAQLAMDISRRTEKAKISIEFWEKFEAKAIGKEHISPAEMKMLQEMENSLKIHPFASELIMSLTETEEAILWEDKKTKTPLKGKLDGRGTLNNKTFILDLKTCQDANPELLMFEGFKKGHHRQAALYADGYNIYNEIDTKHGMPTDFYFIYVEKHAPYGCSVMKCSEEFIFHGRYEYRENLEMYESWVSNGKPYQMYDFKQGMGYSYLQVPAWARQ